MGYFLGVDLGTTYTAAATRRGGHTEIAALSDRSSMVPSVLFLREDDTILVGDAANRRGVTEPGRVAREFKRRFGDSAPLLLGGTPYGADILTSRLLRWVVDRVSEREGAPPDRVAVTHPANWGAYKLDLLRQAVRHADLDERASCVTVSEPQAAATWYATNQRVEPGEVVAVYDLGGGTFDAAVLRRTDDGFVVLGSPEGVERLGGIDFDAAVLAHVAGVLGPAWDALDPDEPTTRAALARLRHECVDAKEALSSDNQASIPVVLPGLHTEVRLTRAELEDMVRPALAETVAVLRRALRGAGVEPDDVARVLLVGGSSRIPLVGQVVGAALGRPIAVDAHPKNAVALGAAVAAATAPAAATDPSPSGIVPVVRPAALASDELAGDASDGDDPAGPGATGAARSTEGSAVGPGAADPHASATSTGSGAADPGGPATVARAGAADAEADAGAPAPEPASAAETVRHEAQPTAVQPPHPGRPGRGPDPRPPVVVPAPPIPRRTAPAVPPPHRPTADPRRAAARLPAGAGARPGGPSGGPSGQHRRSPSGTHRPAGGGRSGRQVVTVAVVVVLLVAIAGVAGALLLQDATDDPDTTPTTTASTTTSEPPPELDADGDGMIDEPGAPPGHVQPPPATAAPEVASLNHAVHEGFERVSIRFTGDLPPTAELHPDPNRGVLRVWFPETSPTGGEDDAAIEQFFGDESELGLSAFLVIDRDGQAFVDIHADGPVTAESFRLITEGGEPVVAVDIQSADGPWTPSTVSVGGVLLDPPAGGILTSTGPILVEGYGRRSGGQGVVEMYDAGGAVVASREVSLPGGGDANGFFSVELQPDAPVGAGTYDIRLTGGSIGGGPPAMVQTTVTVE